MYVEQQILIRDGHLWATEINSKDAVLNETSVRHLRAGGQASYQYVVDARGVTVAAVTARRCFLTVRRDILAHENRPLDPFVAKSWV